MRRHLFLTGTTGFVGRNLLNCMLKFYPDIKISCLIRANSQDEAEKRFQELLKLMGGKVETEKLQKCSEVFVGDVTLPRLGLSQTIYKQLSRSITHIIHSAANVSFQMPLPEARRINVSGTRTLLNLQKKRPNQVTSNVWLT